MLLCVQICTCLSVLVFVIGEITGNVSSVDRLWSLVPTLYTGVICCYHPSLRLLLMVMVAGVWSVRLTYNFWRRGGYSWPPWTGCEDYRWIYVRKWPVLNTKIGWTLFNLVFISFYQNFLLLSLAVPALVVAAVDNTNDVNNIDLLASATFLALVVIETVADNQQEDFQNTKYSLIDMKKILYPFSIGFINWGLFSISRHPNYLAEQLLWLVFYMFSVAATGSGINITLLGPLLLILLFQGSTALSESITGGKYAQYQNYRSLVPRFIGNFWSLKTSYHAVIIENKNN